MKKHKLDINLIVHGMEMNHDTLDTKSLGGSETAGMCMANELAKLGHHINLFCNTTQEGKHNGVNWINIDKLDGYLSYCSTDVTIIQRIPELFQKLNKSKINILWNHDVAVKSRRSEFAGALWNIDEVWGLSDFHINQQSEIYQIDKEAFWRTRNGITPIEHEKPPRKRKRLVFTNRPERGMDILLYDIMPKLWKKDSEIELVIAGYDNTVPQMAEYYNSLFSTIAQYKSQGKKISHVGSLTKKDLYALYSSAGVYVYPTKFKETSCITVMEAQMCGLPMVCSTDGALPETTRNESALLIDGDASSQIFHDNFVEGVLELMTDDIKWNQLRNHGLRIAKENTWASIAKEWSSHLYDMFEERTQCKATLAKHFYEQEDIMALRHLTENDLNWYKITKEEYPYLGEGNTKAYKDFYIKLGEKLKAEMEEKKQEFSLIEYPRVKVAKFDIVSYLQKTGIKKPTILDFGSGVGNESVQFVNEYDANVISVNISEAEMEITKDFINKHCKKPDNIKLIIADDPSKLNLENSVDIVFCGEVLEHQPNPTKFIDKLETTCKNGGLVVFTVPYGEWQDGRHAHLWNYERHDLRDLVGNKIDFKMKMCSAGINQETQNQLGWWIVSYEKSDIKTGTIDLQRKVDLQSPRQTVSVCIITKNAENMLRRTLKSVQPIANEIIAVDNGSTDSTKDILKEFNCKILDSAPATEVGFDTVRNLSIKEAKSDWILWIDSDEELVNLSQVYKYLRPNIFKGYSIRQHHFTTDPQGAFKIDLPIRLFRNHKGVKFFGFVHEHPEIKINDGVGASTVLGDVDIAHDGYFTEAGRRKRFERNIQLMFKDRELYPERNLGKFLMIRDWVHLARYNWEQSGKQMTPVAREYCRKAIDAFRNDFLKAVDSPVHFYLHEGLMFYSEALALLGLGLEYNTYINVHHEKTSLDGNSVVSRFENQEDYLDWVKIVVSQKSEPYEGDYAF